MTQIAELRLLAARAEASIDASLATARYAGVRDVGMVGRGGLSEAFKMFAVSVSIDGDRIRDAMFCRTPETAKFIVALLDFGAEIVAQSVDVEQ